MMALRDESKTRLDLEQDSTSSAASAVSGSTVVVVLLTGGFLDNAHTLVQLAIAHQKDKHLVPVIVETANTTWSFVFPDDKWYLKDLPEIHARNKATFGTFGISVVTLAEAIQTLLLKIAPRFSENESGRLQRASIRTIISRIKEPIDYNHASMVDALEHQVMAFSARAPKDKLTSFTRSPSSKDRTRIFTHAR
jgi:hypothetical protein